ncbi:alpha/beta hydrolase family protein [Nocardia brasiliensis]|uniref:alpha/beta hydrolase family protein n=1 Tax=Nocardia brasiliensis TaxID=37326 RepID=UPI0037B148EC
MSDLRIVFGPDAVTHWATAAELLVAACAAYDVTPVPVRTGDQAEFAAACRAVAPDEEFVVVPGAAALPGDVQRRMIRVDFERCAADRSAGVRTHIRGRGLAGLRYAVADWYFHRCHPATMLTYGTHPYQRVYLRTPAGPGPFPVAVLLHGGYWKPWWDSDLMHAMAVDLTARGCATWNVEYRRPAESSWAATVADVADAFAALAPAAEAHRLDLDRIAVVGHSAGAQLALRLAADARATDLRPAVAVSLAGVLDLRTADRRELGDGAVSLALGHRYSPDSAVYRSAAPIERLPLGIPQLIVCGLDDEPDLLEFSRNYADLARRKQDSVELLELPADHSAVIDPGSAIWRRTAQWLMHTL